MKSVCGCFAPGTKDKQVLLDSCIELFLFLLHSVNVEDEHSSYFKKRRGNKPTSSWKF